MSEIWPYLGNLHGVLSPLSANTALVFCSVVCGGLIGLERESRDKPAGLRTVSLICVGSTIFTLASIGIASQGNDPGRIAAQIVSGIGFLGAGAIIRERGTVIGLTTAAMIWAVAAIGLIVGAGYAAGGFGLTLVVLGILVGIRRLEQHILEACQFARCQVLYLPENGKTRIQLLRILDQYHIPDSRWNIRTEGELEAMDIDYCYVHRSHRQFLYDLVAVKEVQQILHDRQAKAPDGQLDFHNE